tara:strand:+ start:117 stop:449 length:333 start_codon:yes stop_codon:yes gene_type:complete
VSSALERLKKAANLQPVKKVVTLNDGTEFEFWRTPLTMAEREKAQKASRGDDSAFALQLFLMKAMDESGNKLFSLGQAAEIKNDVRDADLQQLMLAMIQEDQVEAIDPKD